MKNRKTLPVYLVDDDIIMIKLLKHKLTLLNIEVIGSFEKGEDCIELAKNTPGIILLDFSLIGLNGLDTLVMIKKKLPKLHVIILTSLKDESLKHKCLNEGAYNYINKSLGDEQAMFQEIYDNIQELSKPKFPKPVLLAGAFFLLLIIFYLIF
ncbi:MAG: response regulator [Cyclobacteriaceae bacterium]|nr:response regulator [Cyclobacteriaceae bacterium]